MTVPTIDVTRVREQLLLREATGYIELGEMIGEPDGRLPAPSARMLLRALETLAALPESARVASQARLLEGEALRALGRWQEALAPLRDVTEREPARIEAWLGLGWCLKRLDRLGEAIEALRQGLGVAPEQAIVHYNLACYLSLARDAATAVEHLSRAISLDGRYRDMSGAESDFDPIRADPRFVAATHLAA